MQPESISTGGESTMENVRRLLGGLRKTAEGEILHGLIDRALQRYRTMDGGSEQAFAGFLRRLLDNYVDKPISDPVTRIKVRVLRQRLAACLPQTSRATRTSERQDDPARHPALAEAARGGAPALAASPSTTSAAYIGDAVQARQPDNAAADTITVDSLPIEATQIRPALNLGFDGLLQSGMATIKHKHGDADGLRNRLIRGIEELVRNQHALDEHLQATTRYLRAIHADRHHLADALEQARCYSLTDELTGLPNRAAFLRQLESEIGRTRRYRFSLALALIDLDDLGAINDRHGRDVGDAVLSSYSREVLSQFRSYDIVARYGNDEFAVLLPNTQREGAMCALEKARQRARDMRIKHLGRPLSLPSFSSVLTFYAPGEKPALWLKRANEALSHAKAQGPRQSVVALQTG